MDDRDIRLPKKCWMSLRKRSRLDGKEDRLFDIYGHQIIENEIENGKQIKDNAAEDVGPPPSPFSKSGRIFVSTGMDIMAWE